MRVHGGWKGEEIGGKQAVCFYLLPWHIAALEADLAAVRARGLATTEIRRDDFPLRDIVGELAPLRERLLHGDGLLVLRGFPVQRWSLADLETVYYGLGTHFGVAVSQSVLGDRLGHVTDMTGTDPHARGYRNRRELTLHTDFSDIVSFLCVRPALEGGENWFASALAVHDTLLAERPDLLRVLYRGFHWHRYGEQAADSAPVTPWRVPVFSECEGHLSCRYIRNYIVEATADESVGPLTDVELEALDCFHEVCHRRSHSLRFTLQAGEAVFIDNFTVMHARTAFRDHDEPARKRLLLRLWMTVPDGRPVVPEIQIYDSGRDGGVPARDGSVPSYARRTEFEAIPAHSRAAVSAAATGPGRATNGDARC